MDLWVRTSPQGDAMEIVEERLRGLLLQGLDADAAA